MENVRSAHIVDMGIAGSFFKLQMKPGCYFLCETTCNRHQSLPYKSGFGLSTNYDCCMNVSFGYAERKTGDVSQ